MAEFKGEFKLAFNYLKIEYGLHIQRNLNFDSLTHNQQLSNTLQTIQFHNGLCYY